MLPIAKSLAPRSWASSGIPAGDMAPSGGFLFVVDRVGDQLLSIVVTHEDDDSVGRDGLLVLIRQRSLIPGIQVGFESFVRVGVDALLLDVQEHDWLLLSAKSLYRQE